MKKKLWTILFLLFTLSLFSCNNKGKNVSEEAIVTSAEEINNKAEELIQETVKDVLKDKRLADSFNLKNPQLLDGIYEEHSYEPLWTSNGAFESYSDSLISFIANCRYYGLFPDDYHYDELKGLRDTLLTDSSKRLDASRWAFADLLLTSAFTQMVKDIKAGRILPDSVMQKDSSLSKEFFVQQLQRLKKAASVDSFATALEPTHVQYRELRQAIRPFVDSANFKSYTYVYGFDSGTLKKRAYQRIIEEDSMELDGAVYDSAAFVNAIKKYQKVKKLKVDGKLSADIIKKLNDTDEERFKRIAITLDRYKQLPPLPEQYIWVNIPSYRLQVRSSDTVVMISKVAVGKSYTRTPEIVSAISDMITYPQWTIPASIIEKEILPGLKKDPGYTNKKGYSIIDKDGNVIDAYLVDWSKYKKGIPYKVVQGSGDANALGVIKFNFPNKHSVYLHDTNQRYLFSRKNRALSHGCVRVESWKDLAYYILERDSLASTSFTPKDSLDKWLLLKQKKVIPVRKRLPVFIKYFTCEGVDGKVVFYEDIYEEDRKLRNKYFATK